MGKGGQQSLVNKQKQFFSAEEVATHANWRKNDSWLAYRGKVYDFSTWAKKHPGGNVITLYAGQDATTSMERFHKDKVMLNAWLKPFYIGELNPEDAKKSAVTKDFDRLTEELTDEGMFESNIWFYVANLVSIIAMDVAAWYYVHIGGVENGGIFLYWCLAALMCTAQAQAGWLQHDFGHCSVFENATWNYYAHQFTISHMKAASKHWWQSRHHRHHAKPNVVLKDPDCSDALPTFMFGEAYFDCRRWYIPAMIPFQKYFWFLLGPPTVTTLLFFAQCIYYMINRKKYWDMFWVMSYFVRFGCTYGPYLGLGGTVKLYFAMRILETQWFTWVTSMSHLPMPMSKDEDSPKDWFTLQLSTTQNVEPGYFNDWFSGHLNYQIEHHLWPTMPRHNYFKVYKRTRALAEKHGYEYRQRGFFQAICDIVEKLDIVAEAYEEWIEMTPPPSKWSNKESKKRKDKTK